MFGKWGNVILGVAMVMACLTTSIGLTTAFGDYFTKLFPKLSYRTVVTVVTLFTWFVSNVGLDTLLDTVLPLLVVLFGIPAGCIIGTLKVLVDRLKEIGKGEEDAYRNY